MGCARSADRSRWGGFPSLDIGESDDDLEAFSANHGSGARPNAQTVARSPEVFGETTSGTRRRSRIRAKVSSKSAPVWIGTSLRSIQGISGGVSTTTGMSFHAYRADPRAK